MEHKTLDNLEFPKILGKIAIFASSRAAKEKILELVKQYYQENHIKKDFENGDRVTYAARVYQCLSVENVLMEKV